MVILVDIVVTGHECLSSNQKCTCPRGAMQRTRAGIRFCLQVLEQCSVFFSGCSTRTRATRWRTTTARRRRSSRRARAAWTCWCSPPALAARSPASRASSARSAPTAGCAMCPLLWPLPLLHYHLCPLHASTPHLETSYELRLKAKWCSDLQNRSFSFIKHKHSPTESLE